MDLTNRVAAAMFNASDPTDPGAPFDSWSTRAQAAINTMKESL